MKNPGLSVQLTHVALFPQGRGDHPEIWAFQLTPNRKLHVDDLPDALQGRRSGPSKQKKNSLIFELSGRNNVPIFANRIVCLVDRESY